MDDESLSLVIERPVDPLEPRVEPNPHVFAPGADGERRELRAIRVPGNGNIQAIDFTSTLTFLTDAPVAVNRLFGHSELVPEVEEDIAALASLGTRRVLEELATQLNTRTFGPIIDPQTIEALIPKTVGLRIYADAVALNADVPKYREFWRILESAFGLHGKRLVGALASYEPSKELGFDEKELSSLLVLRGQVSHAATRGGLGELLRVGGLASGHVGRLKCLAERVILTKQNWGAHDSEVQELAAATSWVEADGTIKIQALLGAAIPNGRLVAPPDQ